MGDGSGIEWTDATWNPLVGCTKVSPGCDHCYAQTVVDTRLHPATLARAEAAVSKFGPDADPADVDAAYQRAMRPFPTPFGIVSTREYKLDEPLKWSEPRRVFVNSLSDLFHDDVPDDYIAQVWAVMSLAPQHTFQLLTKRHARMRALTSSFLFRIMVNAHRMRRGFAVLPDSPPAGPSWPLRNLWLGVSVEDQKWADIRIPALLATPAAVRWVSAEPLLGPVDAAMYLDPNRGIDSRGKGIDWVVVGGESGKEARPMHPDWARSLRGQCAAADVPFLFKQWGEWLPVGGDAHPESAPGDPRPMLYARDFPGRVSDQWYARVGKKAAGRELDGVLHDGYPAVVV